MNENNQLEAPATPHMVVGESILVRGLVVNGSADNLKGSTFNLTIGEIFPMGKLAVRQRLRGKKLEAHYLEPREMVWVLSKEEFRMPSTVTGLATLRTTLTKQGLLALNVGIIDPGFSGPISTALINFSDRPRRIAVGDKFFRVIFLEHDDVSEFNIGGQDTETKKYSKQIEESAYADFSKNFLNVPEFDDEFYFKRFWAIVKVGLTRNIKVTGFISIFVGLFVWFIFEELKIHEFYWSKITDFIKFWNSKTSAGP